MKSSLQIAVCAICFGTWLGCGPAGAKLVTASGDVSFEGKPVSEGSVTFFSKQTGSAATAELSTDGTFHISGGLPAGEYVVSVTPPVQEIVAGAPMTEAPKEYPSIPQKYRSDTTSNLKATIKADSAEPFHFELTP